MANVNITAGLDVGNGYLKGLIKSDQGGSIDEIDLPSGVATMTRPNDLFEADEKVKEVVSGIGINSFYNHLDVSFISPLVSDQWRRLFGLRGINANAKFTEFDVIGRRSKAEQSLSKILVMGCVAAKALKDYAIVNNGLPQDGILVVNAKVALALPITEFKAHRTKYKAEFMNGTHTVTVHNFETPITVRITFVDMRVIGEGVSAQYAIKAKGEPLMNAMLADVRKHGLPLEGITAADVLEVSNTVGIDIGEGTVNFPVMTNDKFNPDASVTFNKGYGSVLEGAMETMDGSGYSSAFSSRKQLASYLQTKPSALKRNFYQGVKNYVDQETIFFAREVADEFGKVLAGVGATTEVVYVYGGGSGSVKDELYDLLLEKVKEMNGQDAAPVLYLDSRYSRHLNREGLYLVAEDI